MNALPVIARELRTESRHPFTYALRLIGAGGLMLGAAFLFPNVPGSSSAQGAFLFTWMHAVLLVAIWLFVPLVTADCISHERREGTLGLLFLTPLTAWDIVAAKTLAHGWRAAALCLAVLPVLTLPILMGGVDAQQGLLSVTILASSFVLSLSAGVLASSWSKQWHVAMGLALSVAGLFLFLLTSVFGLISPLSLPWQGATFSQIQHRGSVTLFAPTFVASNLFGQSRSVQAAFLLRSGTIMVCCLWLFPLAVWLAARNVRAGWQDKPPSPFWLWCERVFCSVILGRGWLKHWMAWYLERNPIGWLELRRWSGRLLAFAWLAVLISILSFALSTDQLLLRDEFKFLLHFMACVLLGSIGFTAAGSFRRERETRVLELLLVTPLSMGQIIGGRLRGLLAQFLPAAGLLAGLWLYLESAFGTREHFGWLWYYGITFVTILFNGLYFSLRTTHHITAVLATLACWLLPTLVGFYLDRINADFLFKYTALALIIISALNCGILGLDCVWKRWRTRKPVGPAIFVAPVLMVFLSFLGYVLDFLPLDRWREDSAVVAPFVEIALSAFLAWRLYRQLQHRDFAFLTPSR